MFPGKRGFPGISYFFLRSFIYKTRRLCQFLLEGFHWRDNELKNRVSVFCLINYFADSTQKLFDYRKNFQRISLWCSKMISYYSCKKCWHGFELYSKLGRTALVLRATGKDFCKWGKDCENNVKFYDASKRYFDSLFASAKASQIITWRVFIVVWFYSNKLVSTSNHILITHGILIRCFGMHALFLFAWVWHYIWSTYNHLIS